MNSCAILISVRRFLYFVVVIMLLLLHLVNNADLAPLTIVQYSRWGVAVAQWYKRPFGRLALRRFLSLSYKGKSYYRRKNPR